MMLAGSRCSTTPLRIRLCLCLLPWVGACGSTAEARDPVEATSLMGRPLMRVEPPEETLDELQENLAMARARWKSAPSEEAAVWVGRRLGYLGRYQESIEWFTRRLQEYPQSFRLRRHRGHRFLSLRNFERAAVDLTRAWALCSHLPDEIEQDGAPNEKSIPRSTLQTNILYHLGLAAYLQGHFDDAAGTFTDCLELCTNDDMAVATRNWLYHALRRAGRATEADAVLSPVVPVMDVIENFTYHRLLLVYKGHLAASEVLGQAANGGQEATAGYGVANWYWVEGRRAPAEVMLGEVVASTPWNAFGHIAAEADLVRR